jgi:hypothetical protein
MLYQFARHSKFIAVAALAALFTWGGEGFAQTFVYVEPNNSSCSIAAVAPQAAPKSVKTGVAVPGVIRVSCGFTEGSYTVSLSSTDSNATFTPKTFLVNFGSLSGSGAFSVNFATVGDQTIFATITSNMGSPVLLGRFVSTNNVVNVVGP